MFASLFGVFSVLVTLIKGMALFFAPSVNVLKVK